MKRLIHFTFVFLVLLSSPTFAKFGSFGSGDARTVGLGNSGSALNQGILGIGKNPATLIQRTDSSFLQFSFPSLSANVSTNTLSLDDVKTYFGGDTAKYLTDLDKSNLVNAFNSDGKFVGSVNVDLFSIGMMVSKEVGAFSLSVSDNIFGGITLPQEMVKLLLNGNNVSETYKFDNLQAQSSYIRTFGLSYARQIINKKSQNLRYLSAGITAKYYMGFSFINMQSGNSSLTTSVDHKITGSFNGTAQTAFSKGFRKMNPFDTSNSTEDFEMSAMPEAAGSGIGADIGIAGELKSGLRFGVSITDIGSFNWTGNAEEHTLNKNFAITDLTNQGELDSLTKNVNTSSKSVGEIAGRLPSTFRIGLAMPLDSLLDWNSNTTILVDYAQGFNDFATNSTTPRISVGLDIYPVSWLPRLMIGGGNDLTGKFRLSGGIGYNYFSFMDFYLSTNDILSFGNGATQASVAMTFLWKVY